jgi:hypothetical protein
MGMSRLKFLVANAILTLTKSLAKVDSKTEHSKLSLVRFGAQTTKAFLEKNQVPSKWWPYIRDLDKVGHRFLTFMPEINVHVEHMQRIAIRNISAHETGEDFARFLMVHPDYYNQYHDLVKCAYHKTVEELVE